MDELARVYDAILDARFERVPAMLQQACGPAPREACQLLDAVNAWWRIQLDPLSTTHDAEFESKVEAAIAATRAWTARDPQRAEAWFYLGGAYGARAQWWVLRGRRLAAARDGRRIKEALERALALDPGMADAYFGLGLYQYYADVAPTALKMLRWIMLLPGGDRSAGMEQMFRARDTGRLVRSEVDYQLHVIDVWYEKQPAARPRAARPVSGRGIRTIPTFRRRWPTSRTSTSTTPPRVFGRGPCFSKPPSVVRSRNPRWRKRTRASASPRSSTSSPADEAALEHLHAVIDARPAAPFAVIARAHLQLGQTLEHLGRRAEATAAYRAAIAAAGRNDPLEIATRARTSLRAIERSSRSTTTQ